ncbi:AMP-binding protein [Carboxylicivirga caseinilyticus]|uniref:AMP-binding protein n=1 Tax=Carboxylicivirga caseinilyticus TaxID=3417572 RepID=UPI003D32A521|nr:AMP-binding protein [Marinilabiliaceae bacterium A049]
MTHSHPLNKFEVQVLEPILHAIAFFPTKNAFFIDEQYYTYQDFAQCISKIREYLKKRNDISSNVGLIANDDLETYASIIAIWLEGLAYVPIHPGHPKERGMDIVKQANIELVLDSSSTSFLNDVKTVLSKNLLFNDYELELCSYDSNQLAYILFTSGSTGQPKGVTITRKNVGAFMEAFWQIGFKIDEKDRCLQCFDLTFDVSVQSFLVPLTKGACTYTIPHDRIKYSYASELLEDHKLTFGAMAPSMVRFLRPYFDEIDLPHLRYNILTAEAAPLNLIEEWSECIPNAKIFDLYGPTEATIYCTFNEFKRKGFNKELNGMFCIGKPMVGIQAIICNDSGEILSNNMSGELCIAGDQVTAGYWKNQVKNDSSFILIEQNNKQIRFYKTGDGCYIDDDGDLMLSGRLDYQVKIQGYRIELGEIEYHTRNAVNGKNAVAVVYESHSGNHEIAMFIEDNKLDEDVVRQYLKSKLPSYMIPTKFLLVESFPINTNGKTDRLELLKILKNE